jgi:hypothetical protein
MNKKNLQLFPKLTGQTTIVDPSINIETTTQKYYQGIGTSLNMYLIAVTMF